MRSARRSLLDEALERHSHLFTGRVLDVGGKKTRKRGSFRPPSTAVVSWEYLNIDAQSEPDYVAPATDVPTADERFDTVMLIEVLEHLDAPEAALREMGRVLKPGGRAVISVPFLYPVHADPHDYQRWTPQKLRTELDKAGLPVVELSPMGSLPAVIFDLCWVAWCRAIRGVRPPAWRLAAMPVAALKPLALALDRLLGSHADHITTGYFVVARRM